MANGILGTKVWYADGSITPVTNRGDWRALPATGFIVAVQYMDVEYKPGFPYRRIIGNSDWYFMNAQREIFYVLSEGIPDEWKDPPPGVVANMLKRGVWIADVDYLAMDAQAMEARTWP